MSELLPLPLREFHLSIGAQIGVLNGSEVVSHYGDVAAEYAALRETVGVLDFSFRGRLCLTGADRVRFLHGQVTNDIKKLSVGTGCYAALTNAKGRMQSDLNVFALEQELLLDFEPGLTSTVAARLEKFIVADDVQVVDVAPHYGLLSVQGPRSESVVQALGLFSALPAAALHLISATDVTLGELYLVNHPRLGSTGFDLYVPVAALAAVMDKVAAAAEATGGRLCGWDAGEIARIEAGIPRYGVDMDESHLASECGIESRAISYQKGCYIGQEVLNRIHSVGHVNRELRRLEFSLVDGSLPVRGDKLICDAKEVGFVTSATLPPGGAKGAGLGYVNRGFNSVGTQLRSRIKNGAEIPVLVG